MGRSKKIRVFHTRPKQPSDQNWTACRHLTHHIAFLNSISKSWLEGSKAQAGIGSIRTPAWNLPRPKITAEPTFGCRLMIVSIVVREILVMMIENTRYLGALGSSKIENIRIWPEK